MEFRIQTNLIIRRQKRSAKISTNIQSTLHKQRNIYTWPGKLTHLPPVSSVSLYEPLKLVHKQRKFNAWPWKLTNILLFRFIKVCECLELADYKSTTSCNMQTTEQKRKKPQQTMQKQPLLKNFIVLRIEWKKISLRGDKTFQSSRFISYIKHAKQIQM